MAAVSIAAIWTSFKREWIPRDMSPLVHLFPVSPPSSTGLAPSEVPNLLSVNMASLLWVLPTFGHNCLCILSCHPTGPHTRGCATCTQAHPRLPSQGSAQGSPALPPPLLFPTLSRPVPQALQMQWCKQAHHRGLPSWGARRSHTIAASQVVPSCGALIRRTLFSGGTQNLMTWSLSQIRPWGGIAICLTTANLKCSPLSCLLFELRKEES